MSAMRPGFSKIIGKVHISRNIENLEMDLPIAANAFHIDYADTTSLKCVHRM
jgi:hypothetical protein